MQSFTNKVIVITGAGSGIGRALEKAFHQEGAYLALNDIDAKGLQTTINKIGDSSNTFHKVLDVGKCEAVERFAAAVVGHFGHVDIVIN